LRDLVERVVLKGSRQADRAEVGRQAVAVERQAPAGTVGLSLRYQVAVGVISKVRDMAVGVNQLRAVAVAIVHVGRDISERVCNPGGEIREIRYCGGISQRVRGGSDVAEEIISVGRRVAQGIR